MYGENHKIQLDSSDEMFNLLDTENFINVISDLEEVKDQNNSLTVYDYFGLDV